MTKRVAIAVVICVASVAPPVAAQHVDHLDSLRARAGLSPLGAPTRTAGPWADRVARVVAAGQRVSGVLTTVIVPALFSDSPAPTTAPDHVQEVFFGTGPTTLSAFYEEASGGELTVTGAASPWVRTSVTWEDGTGGDTTVLGTGPSFGEYLLEAMDSADVHLDFRQFDNDGPDGIPDSGDDDGGVDALAFMFVEVARSCGGSGVWPHFSGLAPRNDGMPWASADTGFSGEPITADAYLIVSGSECDGQPVNRVGVIAHELGHRLGQPDIYHVVLEGLEGVLPENRRWVLGCFDIMAGGAWSCGPANVQPPFGPTQFSPWTRERLGWITLEEIGSVRRQMFTLPAVQTARRGLEIPLDADGTESFLIEYRPAIGFDVDLPASGVLIYRDDSDAPFKPAADGPRHYSIELLEADGDSGLVKTHFEGGNRGVAGDMFVTDGQAVFLSNTSTPSTRLADGTPSTFTIHSIRIVNGEAELVISTAQTASVVANGDRRTANVGEAFTESFLVGGGALPYTVSLEAGSFPTGLSAHIVTDTLVIDGTPEVTGSFDVRVQFEDTRGVVSVSAIPLDVPIVALADRLLIRSLARGDALSDAQQQFLDREGNGNGAFDVGDARAWLRRER